VASDPAQILKFRLDLFNGTLLPYETKDYTLVSSNVVFFMAKSSAPGTSVSIQLRDKPLCVLTPGQYFTLDVSCHYTAINLRFVSSAGHEVTDVIPLDLLNTRAYMVKVKKNQSVEVKHLYYDMKSDILSKKTAENTVCNVEMFK
jgi:hypothetical protein